MKSLSFIYFVYFNPCKIKPLEALNMYLNSLLMASIYITTELQ
nr:MAG TPA: hypothetical protein [Caudoviricetes sp.]